MPANYPTADPSFSAKSAGQKIQSAHVNALQDEVIAIGSALRGTLQHAITISTGGLTVSTGPVSLPNLSVSGGSTFVVRPIEPPPDAVRVGLTSTLAIAGATALNFLSQVYITNSSLHSTAANSSRLTPQSTGIYEIAAQLQFSVASGSTSTVVIAQIQDSSGTALGFLRQAAPINAQDHYVQLRATKRVDAIGTWFKIVANQVNGTGVSLDVDTWAELRKL